MITIQWAGKSWVIHSICPARSSCETCSHKLCTVPWFCLSSVSLLFSVFSLSFSFFPPLILHLGSLFSQMCVLISCPLYLYSLGKKRFVFFSHKIWSIYLSNREGTNDKKIKLLNPCGEHGDILLLTVKRLSREQQKYIHPPCDNGWNTNNSLNIISFHPSLHLMARMKMNCSSPLWSTTCPTPSPCPKKLSPSAKG